MLAAEYCHLILQFLPTAQVSNRSEGAVEKYTTIRTIDGRVAAAIDARPKWMKLDFPLPEQTAKEAYAGKKINRPKPRGISFWVLSKIPTRLSIEESKELLKQGLLFEFNELFK